MTVLPLNNESKMDCYQKRCIYYLSLLWLLQVTNVKNNEFWSRVNALINASVRLVYLWCRPTVIASHFKIYFISLWTENY